MKSLFALFLFLAACTPTQSTTMNSDLLNGTWKLSFINKESPLASDFPNGIPELTFNVADKKVHGSTGCNRVNGSFTLEKNNAISFLPLVTTRIFCSGDGEQRFLEALQSVTDYELEGDKLILLREKNEMLIFVLLK